MGMPAGPTVPRRYTCPTAERVIQLFQAWRHELAQCRGEEMRVERDDEKEDRGAISDTIDEVPMGSWGWGVGVDHTAYRFFPRLGN